jgi:hypothetical protein
MKALLYTLIATSILFARMNAHADDDLRRRMLFFKAPDSNVTIGVAPAFSISNYSSANTTGRYTLWGYQGIIRYTKPFNESFGIRTHLAFSRLTGDNNSNAGTVSEGLKYSDIEAGVLGMFSGFLGVGGGLIHRWASFEYMNGQTLIPHDYSGFLKFAKVSADFISNGGSLGASVSESYIFGTFSDLKVAEFRTTITLFLLFNVN